MRRRSSDKISKKIPFRFSSRFTSPCFRPKQGLSSHSIYDTVLQASAWCPAVTHSTAVIYEESGGAVGRVLKEATWIFEVAGVGIFAGSTYTTTQVM